jgi:Glycosyl transferase family 2
MPLTAAIIIPTRGRAGSLARALASLSEQARDAAVEVLVVDDGPDAGTRAAAEAAGVRYVAHERPRGLNAARNTAIAATEADWLFFVDDDVEVHPGWLAALLRAAGGAADDVAVLAGAIHARIDNPRYRQCGREGAPITFLDADRGVGWGANLGVRRMWVERVGAFDAERELYGDEQEWQDRVRAAGGRVLWVPDAALDHVRSGADATMRALARAAYARGQASGRYDAFKGRAPGLGAELALLARTTLHGPLRRCSNGPVMAAHSLGRLHARHWGASPLSRARDWGDSPPSRVPDFLSGESGHVAGRRGVLRRVADRASDVVEGRRARRLDDPGGPRQRVLVLAVARPERATTWTAARAELERSRHEVVVREGPGAPGAGKFENLNSLLHDGWGAADWLLVCDDDVELPAGFLDRFLAAARLADLKLCQPAHRLHSHAGWRVTRRRLRSTVRETNFVEIGPLTAFHRDTFGVLVPFPALRMGWGLDVHWAALAAQHGWRIGVVDATPILHLVPAAESYPRDGAIAEARAFLAGRPYVRRTDIRTLRTWR